MSDFSSTEQYYSTVHTKQKGQAVKYDARLKRNQRVHCSNMSLVVIVP